MQTPALIRAALAASAVSVRKNAASPTSA